MKKSTALAVVGGDQRSVDLAKLFRADGHEVSVYALERQEFTDGIISLRGPKPNFSSMRAVILPIPAMQDAIYLNTPLSNAPHTAASVLDALPPDMLVLCGAASPTLKKHAQANGLPLIDYLAREELAISNAIPTALSIQS